jgi:hypothetical protein
MLAVHGEQHGAGVGQGSYPRRAAGRQRRAAPRRRPP